MAKLIVAFRNFVKAPKSIQLLRWGRTKNIFRCWAVSRSSSFNKKSFHKTRSLSHEMNCISISCFVLECFVCWTELCSLLTVRLLSPPSTEAAAFWHILNGWIVGHLMTLYHLYWQYSVKLYVVMITFYEVKRAEKETALTCLIIAPGFFGR